MIKEDKVRDEVVPDYAQLTPAELEDLRDYVARYPQDNVRVPEQIAIDEEGTTRQAVRDGFRQGRPREIAYLSDRVFRAGSVVSTTFRICSKHLPRFVAIALVPTLPYLLGSFWLAIREFQSAVPAGEAAIPSRAGVFPELALHLAVSAVAYIVIQAAVISGVHQHFLGREVSPRKCLVMGLRRLGAVLQVSFVTGLLILGCTFTMIFVGIIVWLILAVVVPVAVVENPGVFGALSRSCFLTSDRLRSILLVGILMGLILLVPLLVANRVINALTQEPTLANHLSAALLPTLFEVAALVPASISSGVIYYMLRFEKQDVSTT